MAAAAGGSCETELFVAASWCRSLRAKSPHRMQALAKVKPAWKCLVLLHIALLDIKSIAKDVCMCVHKMHARHIRTNPTTRPNKRAELAIVIKHEAVSKKGREARERQSNAIIKK